MTSDEEPLFSSSCHDSVTSFVLMRLEGSPMREFS